MIIALSQSIIMMYSPRKTDFCPRVHRKSLVAYVIQQTLALNNFSILNGTQCANSKYWIKE